MAQDVRVFVSSHPCMKWAFPLTSLTSPSPSSSFSHPPSTSSSSCYPSTSTRLSSKIPCATSPRRWGQLTSPSPTHNRDRQLGWPRNDEFHNDWNLCHTAQSVRVVRRFDFGKLQNKAGFRIRLHAEKVFVRGWEMVPEVHRLQWFGRAILYSVHRDVDHWGQLSRTGNCWIHVPVIHFLPQARG